MEIKYTLEILTKDIQDIENLVAKLQFSPAGSTLEIDLALSKLRNVYDILSVIRSDMILPEKPDSRAPASEIVSKDTDIKEDEPEEILHEKKDSPASEDKQDETGKTSETDNPQDMSPGEDVEQPREKNARKTRENAEILAEKFLAESSINENLAGARKPDMDSKILGQSIESISRNIGINDRFLIIRELFDGNADGYGKLIRELEEAGNLESARKILDKQFEEDPDHEGIKILSSLVKRKYSKN